jgi:hypothetical protein
MVFALFGLVFTLALATPPKAEAQIHVGVQIGAPVAYGAVVVPVYQNGYHEGYYYDHGYRYQRDYRGSLLSKTVFLRIRVVDFKGHTHPLLLINAGPFDIRHE